MRIGVSLCCAKAGARPAANEKAAAPATKVLRVWLMVLSCHSRKISVRRPLRGGTPHRPRDVQVAGGGLRRPGCGHPAAQPRPQARPLRRLSRADDIWKAASSYGRNTIGNLRPVKATSPEL